MLSFTIHANSWRQPKKWILSILMIIKACVAGTCWVALSHLQWESNRRPRNNSNGVSLFT